MMKSILSRILFIVFCITGLSDFLVAQDEIVNYDDNTVNYNLKESYYIERGHRLLELGDYVQAKQYFEKAIEQDSLNPLAYENLGIALKRLNDQKGLLACFSKAKRIFDENPDFFYFSGDANQKLGNYTAAIADYTRAIAICDNNPDAELLYLYYFNRGNTYIKSRKYKEAKSDFNQVIALDPYHYGAFTNRGMAKYNLKDKSGACSDWGKALEYGNPKVRTYLSKYCN